MRTLQTLLIESAPPAKDTWNLSTLRQQIVADERQACSAGENLGTKLDRSHEPKALATEDRRGQMKHKDPNDPVWLIKQVCWSCGKTGHLRPKCPASQSEKDEYRERRLKEKGAANMIVGDGEKDAYVNAMSVEDFALAAIDIPWDVMTYGVAVNAVSRGTDSPKQWIIDSRCSNHFPPNQSDFASYKSYPTPRSICLGDGSLTPSLGEGIVKLTCNISGNPVVRFIHCVQYVPALTYALLSCKVLNKHGLSIVLKGGRCEILHPDRTVIAQSSGEASRLYFLDVVDTPANKPSHNDSALVATPSFNLVHKHLAHPRKDALQLMICCGLVEGLDRVPDESKDFDCIACIRGKMV